MADETKPEGCRASAAGRARRPPAPRRAAARARASRRAPRPPAAPIPDLAGKTTIGGVDRRRGGRQGRRRAGAQRQPRRAIADDTSPLLTRRAWMGLAWGAFSAASAAALAATGRFMFPNVLNEPPQQFKAGFPNEYGMGVDERWKEKFGIWIVRTRRRHRAARAAASTRSSPSARTWAARRTISRRRTSSSARATAAAIRTDRRQLRRAGAASARARAHRAGRRRPDSRRQEPPLPVPSSGQWTDPEAFLKA